MTPPNLSSWTVYFRHTPIGWLWSASHGDGTIRRAPFPCISKVMAEKDAVRTLEIYESGEGRERINGFALAKRVRERS